MGSLLLEDTLSISQSPTLSNECRELSESDFPRDSAALYALATGANLPTPDLEDQLLQETLKTGKLPRRFNPPETIEEVERLVSELKKPFANAADLDRRLVEIRDAVKEASWGAKIALQEWAERSLRKKNPVCISLKWERELKQLYLQAISDQLGFTVFEASPYGDWIVREGPIFNAIASLTYPASLRIISPEGETCKINIRGRVKYCDGIGTRKIPKLRMERIFDKKLSEKFLSIPNPLWGLSLRDQKIANTVMKRREFTVEDFRDALRFTKEAHLHQLRSSQGLFAQVSTSSFFLNGEQVAQAIAVRDQVLKELPPPPQNGSSQLNAFLSSRYKLIAVESQKREFSYPDRHYQDYLHYLEYTLEVEKYSGLLAITPFKRVGFPLSSQAVTIGDGKSQELVLEVQEDGNCAALITLPGTNRRMYGLQLIRYNGRQVYYQQIGAALGILPPGTICTESGVPLFNKAKTIRKLFKLAKEQDGVIPASQIRLPVKQIKEEIQEENPAKDPYGSHFRSKKDRWQRAVELSIRLSEMRGIDLTDEATSDYSETAAVLIKETGETLPEGMHIVPDPPPGKKSNVDPEEADLVEALEEVKHVEQAMPADVLQEILVGDLE